MTEQTEQRLKTVLHRAVEWRLESTRPRQDPWGETGVVAVLTGLPADLFGSR